MLLISAQPTPALIIWVSLGMILGMIGNPERAQCRVLMLNGEHAVMLTHISVVLPLDLESVDLGAEIAKVWLPDLVPAVTVLIRGLLFVIVVVVALCILIGINLLSRYCLAPAILANLLSNAAARTIYTLNVSSLIFH